MKMKSLMTMSILAAALQITPISFGQDANEPGKGGPRYQEERFANLSADEREKLKAARQKAMQDSVVQAAPAGSEILCGSAVSLLTGELIAVQP